MNRLAIVILALFILSACNDDGPTVSSQTTPDGTAYRLITLPGHEYVSIQIAWASDWAYRPDTHKAAAVVGTELILAGGAADYPAGEVMERFADLDSEGSIYISGNDHVIGELTFAPEHIAETVDIANAHLRAPTLDPVWFDRIVTGTAQNLAEAQSQPAHAGFDALRWAVFGTQPLRNALSLDDPDTFASLTRDDVVVWHQETFTRTPDAITVVGDITATAAGDALDKLLAGLPEAQRQPLGEATPDFRPRRILLHVPTAQVTTLAFVGPLPPTAQGGEMEDVILIQALGGDDQSALFNAVRTELRASYGFGAGTGNYSRAHRILFMTGEVETARLAAAESVVRNAYAAFLTDGPHGALEDWKKPLQAHFAEMPEYVVDQARSELQAALDGFAPGTSLGLAEVVQAVTRDSLLARLRDAFPAPDSLIVVATSADADALPGACVITTPRAAADCP